MNEKEVLDFLGRNREDDIVELLNSWSSKINDLTLFGGELFCDILENTELKNEHLPALLFFRNILELTDSISVLLENQISEPTRIVMRTLLESTFYLDYITEKDFERRSLSFLLCYFHQKLDSHKKLSQNTDQGLKFITDLENDKYFKGYKFEQQDLLNLEIKNIEDFIKSRMFAEVEYEYQRLKKKNKTRPNWYNLFNGPNNIETLAKYLGNVALYQVLYRGLSKNTHGTDIIDKFIFHSNSKNIINFSQIRAPYTAQNVCQFAITLTIENYKKIISTFLPSYEPKFQLWYNSQMREFILQLANNTILNVK